MAWALTAEAAEVEAQELAVKQARNHRERLGTADTETQSVDKHTEFLGGNYGDHSGEAAGTG